MFGHGRHGELDPIARAGRNPPAAAASGERRAASGERLRYDLAGRKNDGAGQRSPRPMDRSLDLPRGRLGPDQEPVRGSSMTPTEERRRAVNA